MSDKGTIVRFVAELADGTVILERADGSLEKSVGKSDWARVDAMTEEELEASIKDDPDYEGFEDIDWSTAEIVMPPTKTAVSIRLDDDVVGFFKAQGRGYQTRINAVLRSYMRDRHARAERRQKTKKKA